MKVKVSQLKKIIREEVQRLHELHPGNKLQSHLAQAVKHVWEADNQLTMALQQADQTMYSKVDAMHKAVEKLAFDLDTQLQQSSR